VIQTTPDGPGHRGAGACRSKASRGGTAVVPVLHATLTHLEREVGKTVTGGPHTRTLREKTT